LNRSAEPEKQNLPGNIWTIGHSKRSAQEFLETLEAYGINLLADVRRFPSSRSNSQFNQNELAPALRAAGIEYIHFPELGGRRRPRPDSDNALWRNASFRGYADYMETAEFEQCIDRLIAAAAERRVAIMCAEAVWWRCHRRLIADYLECVGIEVTHILTASQSKRHPLTPGAQIVQGRLYYRDQAGP